MNPRCLPCFNSKEVHLESSARLRNPTMSFEVQPIGILDHREKVLRNKVVLMVKVLWRSDRVEEMIWETEL